MTLSGNLILLTAVVPCRQRYDFLSVDKRVRSGRYPTRPISRSGRRDYFLSRLYLFVANAIERVVQWHKSADNRRSTRSMETHSWQYWRMERRWRFSKSTANVRAHAFI